MKNDENNNHKKNETIENTETFKAYKREHQQAYLAHHFSMRKGAEHEEQIGYFDPETKEITTFTKNPVTIIGSDKSFNPDDIVKPLNMKEVNIPFEDALADAQKVIAEQYPAHKVTQEICILQHLDKQLWNMTLITESFSIINIRIDAASGEIIHHEQHSIMDLGRTA